MKQTSPQTLITLRLRACFEAAINCPYFITHKVIKNSSTTTYEYTLKFTLIDNFGLDRRDLGGSAKSFLGFDDWYILQHYDKYKSATRYQPFKTVYTEVRTGTLTY
jgi:hypothetical protein